MSTYTVRAPNGRAYKIQGPPGATQAQVEAAVLKAYPEAGMRERKIRRSEASARGVARGFEKVGTFFAGAIGDLVDKFGITPAEATAWAAENLSGKSPAEAQRIAQNLKTLPGFGDLISAGGKAREVKAKAVQRQRPNAFLAGNIVGDVAVTAPLGGLVAKPVTVLAKAAPRMAPVLAPIARSIETAGMSTGIKATTAARRAVDAALRVVTGATTGGATSVLLGDAADEGVAVGAVVSLFPLIGRYGVGPVWDALRGRVGQTRAAKIFRESLGANVDAAREAFRNASAEGKRTASQVLARVGIDADTFFATGDLVAKSGSGTGVLDDIARGQETARKATVDAAAGALTRRGSRVAATEQRAATTAKAMPIMNESLDAANVNTQNVLAAQRAATAGRQAAEVETNTARRLLTAAERQRQPLDVINDIDTRFDTNIFDMNAINQQRGRVGGLERFGSEAAERGLEAGTAARTAEQRLAELKNAGVAPLDAGALSGRLRQMANVERANPEKASLLTGFANQLEDLARANGGVIDARDLYELRKDAGGIVERLLRGSPPDAIRRRTAEVVGATRPLIDDAIQAAGGARWREYLETFSAGMDEARGIELSDYARQLFTDRPEQFQRLMRGDRPDIVKRFFGAGRDDIAEALGPVRLPALKGVAVDLGVDKRIKDFITPGAAARANELMRSPTNVIAEASRSLPFNVGYPISAASDIFENRFVAPRVTKALERGFASPQGANALLAFKSAGERGINLLDSLSPDTLRALQQFGIQIGREPPTNAMNR